MKAITSRAIPLNIENIDTDQIIPASFLKSTSRTGFGTNLFNNWRYYSDGSINEQFVLNDARYSGSILVAGNNFGCGSSREHAAWAIKEYGFKAIISTQFADIFKGNALNNGILPIELAASDVSKLLTALEENPAIEIAIDIEKQTVKVAELSIDTTFNISPFKKLCIMEGLDETQYLMGIAEEIKAFESQRQLV